ncbi:NADP-dependent oxidoreductase [Amycolatopsis nigrescens]|uniref:NADP-dependent oxidoreductase n=1 Tax=Amycolatopsis nigrescens TaxID=381445 RepID=UPI000363CC62|nr:NADP-dependent oxidoreductase [Amycolatopsis nigrescens]
MKALIAPSYGPLEQLEIAEVPVPEPGPGQLLIRVGAAALNALDAKLALGVMREIMPIEHPFVLGMDVAGVVTAAGADVTGFSVGDEVLAYTGFTAGTIAEYTVVDAGPQVVKRPAGLDVERAAALSLAGITAATIVHRAGPLDGRGLLVIGATGGVGSFVVQLAAHAGAEVLATAQPGDAEFVRDLGAAEVIDYTGTDTVAETRRLRPDGVDLAVDLVTMGPALAGTAAAVRDGGRILSPISMPATFERGVTAEFVDMTAAEGRLARLADEAANGGLVVEIGAKYPFGEAPLAVRDFAGKHTRGKIVLTF